MRWKKWMGSPVWPALLSAFVAPGVGQFANREPGKGLFLLTTTIGTIIWLSKILTERLISLLPGPPETWPQDKEALRAALQKLIEQTPDMFFTFQILMIVVWVYSIVDAYMGARARAQKAPEKPA